MAAAPLVVLLLLLLPPALREYFYRRSNGDDDVGTTTKLNLHPIVLVPGVTCSELEARLTEAYRPSVPRCGAMKGKGWFGLWENSTDLAAQDYVQCFLEQMSLVYDPVVNDYRNLPGVEIRVSHFGSSTGFQKNPEHKNWCLENLRHELEKIGYQDGDTLFGAPYDLRHAPPIRGQPSQIYTRYFAQVTELIERASNNRQGKKVILFGHSFGGTVAMEFLRHTPMAWRDMYIKHLVLAAPITSAAGFLEPVTEFTSGPGFLNIPTATRLSLRPMWRSFETAIANFPSAFVFGDSPLVITKQRNYSAHDMEDFLLAALSASGDDTTGVAEAFRRRQLPKMRNFQAPMVPVTCINGVGSKTPEQLVYWEGDFDTPPQEVYGDGDRSINLISMLAFDEKMRRQPRQRRQFKSIKLPGAEHGTIVTDEWALKRVVQEILEANRI